MMDALFDLQTPAAGVTPVASAAGQTPDAWAVGSEDGAAVNAQPGGGRQTPPTTVAPLLDIHVVGIPAPQGSKKGFYNPRLNRVQIVDDNKRPLRDWRTDVKNAAEAAIAAREGTGDPFAILGDAVEVDMTFLLARPKGHYGTGRNAGRLRDSAPARPTTKPDVDKLIRSTLDALKAAGVYADDSQVVTVTGRKHYATQHTGAAIHIYTGGNA